MYTVRIFMKCMHVCAAQKRINSFTKLYIKPDFPFLPDEIAEPHPDMNIKVAAFTVSEKSSNSYECTFISEKLQKLIFLSTIYLVINNKLIKYTKSKYIVPDQTAGLALSLEIVSLAEKKCRS